MSTVGGVMYLDLLKLPPQAKKVGSWVIQDSKLLGLENSWPEKKQWLYLLFESYILAMLVSTETILASSLA